MTTRADALVSRIGELVAIYRETEGAVGTYGDPAATWAVEASERMFITRPRPAVRDGIAGRIDESAYIACLLSDSVVRSHDYLLLDGVKYEVVNVDTTKIHGYDFTKVAQLKKMTEGT